MLNVPPRRIAHAVGGSAQAVWHSGLELFPFKYSRLNLEDGVSESDKTCLREGF